MFRIEPQGNMVRHLNTLTALICGIVGSGGANLPRIAQKTPAVLPSGLSPDSKPESRVKRFHRWLKNDAIDCETYFVPFAQALLQSLCHLPLYLVIDGSVVGRGCMTLMVGVVYKKRVLPLAWIVAKRKKGHFPEELHLELIREVEKLVPPQARVILLGDGEFDGVDLQSLVNGWKWEYVLRTGANIILNWDGEQFTYRDVADHIQPGECIDVLDALFTQEGYGPILAITWWRKDCKEPVHLVTNMSSMEQACDAYRKRFRIETFFSDQKSRGFHLHKSHLSDPGRLSRLLIAASLAYFWIIYLGAFAVSEGWHHIIHRTDRCDLSLFQLGLRLLEHFMDSDMPIPVAFHPLV